MTPLPAHPLVSLPASVLAPRDGVVGYHRRWTVNLWRPVLCVYTDGVATWTFGSAFVRRVP